VPNVELPIPSLDGISPTVKLINEFGTTVYCLLYTDFPEPPPPPIEFPPFPPAPTTNTYTDVTLCGTFQLYVPGVSNYIKLFLL
jgi:hypothetical protein